MPRSHSSTSSDDLTPPPSSPSPEDRYNDEVAMDVLEDDDIDEDSDGADSVTQRIRAFNKNDDQPMVDSDPEEEEEVVVVVEKKASAAPAVKKRKSRQESESEAESSDYEPSSKKGKGKAKKTKTKTKKKVKGKGKGKAKEEKKEPSKKVLRAKAAMWDDLPDWEDRQDSPLLALPGDVLDKCFGANQDLELRDWISLAGVNKFFRHHLNDAFFHEVWFVSGKEESYRYPNGALAKKKDKIDPATQIKTFWDNRPKGLPAWAAFTRDIKPWYNDPYDPISVAKLPPKPYLSRKEKRALQAEEAAAALAKGSKPKFKHYTPHGPRAKWTRAQYTVYKEEKSRYANRQRKKRLEKAEEAAEKALADAAKYRWIKVGRLNRTVLGVVLGRKHGEEAIKKDDVGLPFVEPREEGTSDNAEAEVTEKKKKKKKRKVEEAASLPQNISADELEALELAKIPLWLRNPQEEWGVPETDDEDEPAVYVPVIYDSDGKRVPHDYWPSEWRKVIAEEVNGTWINLTDAMKTFKVSKAELITLRHTLITNPLSAKQPQQMFLKPAVEALAYRSHGGHLGHLEHMLSAAERAKKAIDGKQAKVDAARANGENVPQRKHIIDPLGRRLALWCGAFCGRYDCDDCDIGCSSKCWCKTGGWK